MVRRNAAADPSHVEALLRLVGRRPDADLVFADAGRRAARRAVRGLLSVTRLAARAVPRAFGYMAARRAARAVFAGELKRESRIPDIVDAAPRRLRFPRLGGGAHRPWGRRLAALRLPQGESDRRPHPRRYRDGDPAAVRPPPALRPSGGRGPPD